MKVRIMNKQFIPIDYNKKTLVEEINKKMGWDITEHSLWTYEKKGFLKPSSYVADGKRMIPIYYHTDFDYFVEKLELLNKQGKIRIKVA